MEHTRLPIDGHLQGFVSAVAGGLDLVLRASPGCGKTTRLPPALARGIAGQILVLEPRRIAARLSAERVAREMGEGCGGQVGYHIRFDHVASKSTRVKFITEGLFQRYLLADPSLSGVGCVVLDEFHERHVHSDVALALTRHLQATRRPDLRLVVMSATMDTGLFEGVMPGAMVATVEAPVYPVVVEYADLDSAWPLSRRVAESVWRLAGDPRCPGHVLVFLSGAREIRDCAEALRAQGFERGGWRVLELRGGLAPEEQALAFADLGCRKVILSTNVAETSVTIPGVTGVVDAGYAKIPGQAPWSGLPTLDTRRVSQASCAQRAGRAGRTAPGVALRLFPERDFHARPAFERPEIHRVDLTETRLALAVLAPRLGLPTDVAALPWVEAPTTDVIQSADRALRVIGAMDDAGRPTEAGIRMAGMPLHPRLARVCLEAERRGNARAGAFAAALLSDGARFAGDARVMSRCDVWPTVASFASGRPLVDRETARRARASAEQILGRGREARGEGDWGDETALCRCLLAGFPDRVARARQVVGRDGRVPLNLCQGGGALLSRDCAVRHDGWLVAIEAEESLGAKSAAEAVQIRVAAAIDPAWLSEMPELPEIARAEVDEVEWDREATRVRGWRRRYYGRLLMDERQVTPPIERASALLLTQLEQSWPKPFDDTSWFDAYGPRVAVVVAADPSLAGEFPDLTGADFPFLLDQLTRGRSSFAELRALSIAEEMGALMDWRARQALDALAPREVVIGAGRRVLVRYEADKEPWIESRLQDFFGTLETPRVGGGRVPLTLHLLAPNKRPVQVTRDLASFWRGAYPTLRRELSRNYPKHYWPEDPTVAEPPPANRLRPR